jgi:hypothetical protein
MIEANYHGETQRIKLSGVGGNRRLRMAEGEAASKMKSILDISEFNNGKLDSPNPLAQPPIQPCPECGSRLLYKDGLRYLRDGSSLQRWLCRKCGYRFSERKPLQKNLRWQINRASAISSKVKYASS